ncbi:MAG: methyltransferase [Planctomycetota bacterium]|jgi:methylase of polypeptide subunit release factors
MSSTAPATERPDQRHGDNLYPVTLTQRFGDVEMRLDVPEGVWNPTRHGVHLGNMLLRLDFTGERVLELGTGCGIHAILLARRGAARLTMTEIEAAINDNARHNLGGNGVAVPCDYLVADWTNVPGASHAGDAPWDTVVTNPPFAKSGKRYRRHFIDTLILDAHKLVRAGGRLVYVQSSMADVPRSIRLMEECGMTVRVVGETEGPFRDYYFEDDVYLKEMAAVPGSYSVRDGVHYERLIVFEARLPG